MFKLLLPHASHAAIREYVDDHEDYSESLFHKNYRSLVKELTAIFLPHVSEEDEDAIRNILVLAIQYNLDTDILNDIDTMWFKSYSVIQNASDNDSQRVYALYSDLLGMGPSLTGTTIASIYETVIDIGIKRHVELATDMIRLNQIPQLESVLSLKLLDIINNTSIEGVNTELMKTKLQTFTDDEHSAWIDQQTESSLLSSRVKPNHELKAIQMDRLSIYHLICNKLDTFYSHDEVQEVVNGVSSFFSVLGKNINDMKPEYKCEPILVGSAKENTRTFWPDEFDFVLLLRGQSSIPRDLYNDCDTIAKCLSNINISSEHPNLYMQKHHVLHTIGRKFPALPLTWRGDYFKDLSIKVDLVPSVPITYQQVDISIHPFLPNDCSDMIHHTRHNEDYFKDLSIKVYSVEYDLNSYQQVNIPTHPFLPNDCPDMIHRTYDDGFSFSLVESSIIKALSANIREGYRLAKAMRNSHIIAPVADDVIALGVADDMQDLIKSYMLKTCVFVLTRDLQRDDKTFEYDRVYWAIQIYERFSKYLHDGVMEEYFRKGFRLLDCKHAWHGFRHVRWRCCRKREAMLLITDCILQFLRTVNKKRKTKLCCVCF